MVVQPDPTTQAANPPTTPVDPDLGGSDPAVRISWLFMAVVLIAVWILFFNGYETIMAWATPAATSPVVTVYQTATAAPTGQKIVPTTMPIIPAPIAPPAPVAAPIVPLPTIAPATNDIAGNEATSQAMYEATVAAVSQPEQPAVIAATPIPAPAEDSNVGSHPYGGDHPADAPAQSTTGEKIRNPQKTHECPSGQTWIDDKGCRWNDGHLSERHP